MMSNRLPDDELWLESLAGRGEPGSATSHEAQELRAAILARELDDIDVVENDPEREQQLLARARREGLIPQARYQPRALRFSLAAAAVICLGLTFWLTEAPEEEAFVVRSTTDGIVHIEALDPHVLKQQLLSDLRAAGVPANGYERLGNEGIDADLPPVLTRDIVIVLDRYGLSAPTDGVLRVEIVARDE